MSDKDVKTIKPFKSDYDYCQFCRSDNLWYFSHNEKVLVEKCASCGRKHTTKYKKFNKG